MKRRKSSGAFRKEKVILTASSVLVLAAMTVTGVFIYNSSKVGTPEENVVDFSALENSAQEKNEQVAQAQNPSAQNLTSGQDNSGELDYDPYYAEQDRLLNEAANAAIGKEAEDDAALDSGDMQEQADIYGNVGYAEITGNRAKQSTVDGNELDQADGEDAEDADANGAEDAASLGEDADGSKLEPSEENGEDEALEAVANVMQEENDLHFSEDTKLAWPIAGDVLLNYSMDKTIYFQTLQQYKYNPSIVIGAAQGTSVASAADGIVKSIYKDPQTGTTVLMSLGDGYELAYGQLTDVMVEEGDFVESGAFIGKVAAPTKYYTVEGTNVYFKMTKDGEPVNPMNYLG